jgi:hypothetical protein
MAVPGASGNSGSVPFELPVESLCRLPYRLELNLTLISLKAHSE